MFKSLLGCIYMYHKLEIGNLICAIIIAQAYRIITKISI